MRCHPVRAAKTIAIYLSYIVLAMMNAVVGPTLLDLRTQLGRSLNEVAYIIPGRAAGFAVGSLVMGFLYDKLNFLLTSSICITIVGVMVAAIPHLHNLPWLIGIFVINGASHAFIETGFSIFVFHLWGQEAQPFLFTVTTCYAIGSLISPMLAKPFLVSSDDLDLYGDLYNFNNTTNASSVIMEPLPSDLKLIYPYSIIGGLLVASGVYWLVMYILWPQTPPHPSRAAHEEGKDESDLTPKQLGQKQIAERNESKKVIKCMMLGLLLLFIHICYGLEITFGNFLTTFVAKAESLPIGSESERKAIGATMTTVFWVASLVMRIFGIVTSDCISTTMNMFGCLGLCLVSNGFLTPPFGSSSIVCLWVGVSLVGAGYSTVWASCFNYIEQYYPLTSKITASISIAAVIGEFIFPVVISAMIVTNPETFLWVTMASTVAILVIFTAVHVMCRKTLEVIPK